MDDQGPHKLSTSALAKALDLPSQQLFSTLKDYGWIRKLEDGWVLTAKGEFEGGEYVHSKRYGRYIVWPPELAEHPLFKAMEDNRHLSATALGKHFDLTARETNRVLSEQGWIKHDIQGWELTELGQQKGGTQLENDSSGTFYVVWPQAVVHDAVLSEQLRLCASIFRQEPSGSDDLFSSSGDIAGIDGHHHNSVLQLQVCHWLYLAGIAHAVKRRLPVEETLFADFYLPAHHLYIECWDDRGEGLSQRMTRREIYRQLQFPVIDIESAHIGQIDEVLTREMRKAGIRVI